MASVLPVGNLNLVYRVMTRYPMSYGFDPNGLFYATKQIGSGSYNFTFNSLHPITWVQSAFLATRGSTIWYFDVDNTIGSVNFTGKVPSTTFTVNRCPSSQYAIYAPAWTSTGVGGTDMNQMCEFFRINQMSGSTGFSITDQRVQSMQAVVLPNYSNYLYNGTAPTTASKASTIDGGQNDCFAVVYEVNDWESSSESMATYLTSYCGIGTDYTVMGFLHCPTVYLFNSAPAYV